MKQSRQENITYLVVWGLLFVAPLLSLYVRTISDSSVTFDWAEVFLVWRKFAIFLALFLVHNFLLAPLLVHHHRRVAYFTIMAVVIAAFTLYQCKTRPRPLPVREGSEYAHGRLHDGMRPDGPHDGMRPRRPPHDGMGPERPPQDGMGPEMPHDGMRPGAGGPPPIVGERDILSIVVLLLMFGANLGIKVYFRSRDDRKRLAALERENLEQQLEYLRYQINPHFFMNTLNNIHALVDIDPEQAKDTILELSKMMRFVLYEGNKQSVPLSRELDFVRHYVALMQLRYTDKVRITLNLPTEVPDCQLPPLILITFIENAFKHGVSYQQASFVEVTVVVEDGQLRFSCRNSKSEAPLNPPEEGKMGGVGLENVRKRLHLLYGNNYARRIHNDAAEYSVELNIPLS
jgi:hypothetical protein